MNKTIRLMLALGLVMMATSACKTKQKVTKIPAGANIEATAPTPTPAPKPTVSVPIAAPTTYTEPEVTRNENFSLIEGENSDAMKFKYHVVVGSFNSQVNAGDNQFKVYNSVPEEAHDVCHGKYCHEFVQGKLYKCHHVALLPEFMKQYYVDISDSDLALLNSYKPLTADQSIEEYQNFVNGIRNTMPQCKLCPSKLETILLQSSTDKPKVVKLKYLKNK